MAALHEYGIRITVMNPLFIKQSGGGSIRKVKTDKADAQNKFLRIYYARVKECLLAADAWESSES